MSRDTPAEKRDGLTAKDGENLLRLLSVAKVKKNTVPLSEFSHYLPLFTKPENNAHIPPTEDSTDEEYYDHEEFAAKHSGLCQEWCTRISPYHEVLIVADDDPTEIIERVPPILTTIPDLSESDNDAAHDVLGALMNNIERSDGYRDTVTPVSKELSKIIRENTKQDDVEKTREVFNEHVNRIEGGKQPAKAAEASVNVSKAVSEDGWD